MFSAQKNINALIGWNTGRKEGAEDGGKKSDGKKTQKNPNPLRGGSTRRASKEQKGEALDWERGDLGTGRNLHPQGAGTFSLSQPGSSLQVS